MACSPAPKRCSQGAISTTFWRLPRWSPKQPRARTSIWSSPHDAIDDCEVPHELIAEIFGKDVADLVAELTDDKRLPKECRKRLQLETAHKKSLRAKILKLADKTSNLRTLVTGSPTGPFAVGWSRGKWSKDCGALMVRLRKNSTRQHARQSVLSFLQYEREGNRFRQGRISTGGNFSDHEWHSVA
jgi:hypothetical protein